MNYISKIIISAGLSLALILGVSSCKKDFLGVSDQLAPEIDVDKIFSVPGSTWAFYANIYRGIPVSSNFFSGADNHGLSWPTGLDNPWGGMSDELRVSHGAQNTQSVGGYNAGTASFGRWTTLYQLIRQANIFMTHARPIPQEGDADFLSEENIKDMKNKARFFRAYYHYLLFEQYGPVPVMTEVEDPARKDINYARNSVDEVVEFIKKELDTVAVSLPDMPDAELLNRRSEPTKAVALAVKAKLMVYAASPLFNGGYAEALKLTNTDGKQLFPAANPSKWKEALTALQQFIDFAGGRYELFKILKPDGTLDADESLYRLFIEADIKRNKEVIWATPRSAWGNVSDDGSEKRTTPRNEGGGMPCVGVLQELVDAFFMKDGLSIKESKLYNETSFTVSGNASTDSIFNMYVNREPRFYQTVFYQNRKWQITNRPVQFHQGSANDRSSPNNPYSGYLLFKGHARNVYNQGSYPRSLYRPSIVFRLADFYLLYAEALNEVNPGDTRVLEYIDKVRERAGIPKLADIKPQIKGNKEAQREAIIAERRVELAAEGHRYFDVRRWMIAERNEAQGGGRQGGSVYGMDMTSKDLKIGGFYKRVPLEVRSFNRAMYLYPIPLEEIMKSKDDLLIQNPGW